MTANAELLEELVFQVLERRESGDHSALDELCSSHPDLAEELQRRMATLQAALPAEQPSIPEQLGEFRLLRRLGQGGMGVVYLAEQPSLGRRVALKVLRPEQLYFSGSRERFRREIDAVARLSHPGIVQVYAGGEAQGLPYYCMEWVEGVSLDQVLAQLRGSDPARLSGADLQRALLVACREHGVADSSLAVAGELREPPFALAWVDACLWLAREAAQALDHAHQRGVLHRDVKPSNLLITTSGRVLLVDFGLASTRDAQPITRSGAQVGSLPYMAPEQVAGQPERIGEPTDVYALGAVLYELFTLRPAFHARDAQSLGQLIARGRPQPARALNAALPADAAMVCATAMEVDAKRRYASAADMARDLSNVLQRRPIEARALGSLLLVRRWAQRRPAAATALALGALVAVLGPLGFGLREAHARERIEQERFTAERNLTAALDAIEFLLERVGHQGLRDVPQVAPLRRELLERATELYGRLETDSGASRGDAGIRLRVARSLGRLARLRKDLGDQQAALAGMEEAEQRLRALHAEFPLDADIACELGQHLAFAAIARHGPTGHQLGAPALEEALEIIRLAATRPNPVRRVRLEEARALLGLAHYRSIADRHQEARAYYQEVEQSCDTLRAEQASDRDALELWATGVGRLAGLDYSSNKLDDAAARFERVLAGLSAESELSSYARQLHALAGQMLGRIREKREGQQRDFEVDRLLEGSLAQLEQLAQEFPHDVVHATNYGSALSEIGDRALKFGDFGAARARLELALTQYRRRIERSPEDALGHSDACVTWVQLSEAQTGLGDLDAARVCAAKAVDAARVAWTLVPRQLHRNELLSASVALANAMALSCDFEGCAEAGRAAAAWLNGDAGAELVAAQCLGEAARLAREVGQAARADELDVELLMRLERALDLDPSRAKRALQVAAELQLEKVPAFAEFCRRAADYAAFE